jgi:tRNA(Ile)-lysidine synthase
VRGSHPERALERTIERDGVIRRGERVLIACSGGPDSVALAAALQAIANELQLELRLAHVNHAVRQSAWQDECVVASLAATLDLEFDVVHLPGSGRGEAALRDARYDALVALAERLHSTSVALAHHAEDQSETVLLALFRGTGPGGIAGMRARRPLGSGVDLVRPLLRVSARDLRRYCHLRGLPYAVDPTNADPDGGRNAVRRALADLRSRFAGLDEAIARAAQLAGDERDLVSRADLRRHVRDRIAPECRLTDVDFEHVEAVVRTLETGGSGTFHMKPGISLKVVRGEIAGITKT